MTDLVSCASCDSHVRRGTCVCPHCGGHACTPRAGTPAALLLGLALTGAAGCQIGVSEPEYGVAIVDADDDGYPDYDDCDDDDPDVHPDAEEIPGDGVDSNCNDDDDT